MAMVRMSFSSSPRSHTGSSPTGISTSHGTRAAPPFCVTTATMASWRARLRSRSRRAMVSARATRGRRVLCRDWLLPRQGVESHRPLRDGLHPARGPRDLRGLRLCDSALPPEFPAPYRRMKNALESGEDLLSAMARLQQKGDFSAFGTGSFSDFLTEDQRTLLAAMLGPDLLAELASSNLSSAALEARIRSYLEEKLSSGGASGEFLSSFRESASSLFSGGAWSSESASCPGTSRPSRAGPPARSRAGAPAAARSSPVG